MLWITRSTLVALVCLSLLASDDASGQVSVPGGSATLRERGILNRFGARRESRQQRLNRPAANNPLPPPPNAARGVQAGSGQPEQAPELDDNGDLRPAFGQPAVADRRDTDGARRAQYAPANAAGSPTGVQPASAVTPLPPNRLPHTGSGVSLRLSADLTGEVNYLIDEAQHMVISSGEEQRLGAKPRYEIRFSRGIDEDGRSYGEARYTITEGAYRFAVTENGWELFREPEAPKAQPADVVKRADGRADGVEPLQSNVPALVESAPLERALVERAPLESAALETEVPEPLEPSELSELRPREPSKAQSGKAQSAEAETLPTPTLRSILERQ